MADGTESQPFLTDDYRDDPQNKQDHEEDYFIRALPASAHFRRALRVLVITIAFLSFSMLGLLIANYVLIHSGTEFQYTWNSLGTTQDLLIVIFTIVITTFLNMFLAIPIFLNLLIHLTLFIVALVYACRMFFVGWPDKTFCGRWDYHVPGQNNYTWDKGSASCNQSMNTIKVLMGIASSISIVIGLLLFTTTILQLVALARTKVWRRTNFNRHGLRNWRSEGLTIQFTLAIIPPTKQDKSTKIIDAEVTEGSQVVTADIDQSRSLIEA